MAKKKENAPAQAEADKQDTLQRPAAETLYAKEMARLAAATVAEPRPLGWRLSPRAVLSFILGDTELGIAPKFVGRRASWSGRSSPWPPTAG